MAQGSAPGERRGGRTAGTPNRRTAQLRDAIAAEGVEPAVALVRIAKAAEDREEFALAVEAYGKVLPFLHSRPKPTEADPDALVDLERRLIRAKIEETAEVVSRPGIAERLQRAKARVRIADADTNGVSIEIGPEDAKPMIDVTPAACLAPSAGSVASRSAPAPEPEAPAYKPILPRSSAPTSTEERSAPASTDDWSAPASNWPEQQAFADGCGYTNDPYSADPLGFLANRD